MLVIFEKKIKVKEGGGGFKKRFVCVIGQNGIVKICAVKKYPKFDFATYRTSIAVTTINSFLEFCQGRRRRLF